MQDLEQEFGEVEGHPPVIDRAPSRTPLQVAFMDDRMILEAPPWPRPPPRTQPPKKDDRPTPWRVEGERRPRAGAGAGTARR